MFLVSLIVPDFVEVAKRRVEHFPFAVLLDPGNGIVVIVAFAFLDIDRVVVDAHQYGQILSTVSS